MNVSGKFVLVEFRLHNLRLVSAPEQVAAFGVFAIHGLRVGGIERLHELSEISLAGFQLEMIMIGHAPQSPPFTICCTHKNSRA